MSVNAVIDTETPESGSRSTMLLPRFTLRTLLGICTVFALVFVVVGTAYRGQYWAWGFTIAVIGLAITAMVHVAWFAIVSLLASVMASNSSHPPAGFAPGPASTASGEAADKMNLASAVELTPTS